MVSWIILLIFEISIIFLKSTNAAIKLNGDYGQLHLKPKYFNETLAELNLQISSASSSLQSFAVVLNGDDNGKNNEYFEVSLTMQRVYPSTERTFKGAVVLRLNEGHVTFLMEKQLIEAFQLKCDEKHLLENGDFAYSVRRNITPLLFYFVD